MSGTPGDVPTCKPWCGTMAWYVDPPAVDLGDAAAEPTETKGTR